MFLVVLFRAIRFLLFVLNEETRIVLIVLRIFEHNILNNDKRIDDLNSLAILRCLGKSCLKTLIYFAKRETNKFRLASCLSFVLEHFPCKVDNFGILFKFEHFLITPLLEDNLCNLTDSQYKLLYKTAVLVASLEFNKFAMSKLRINGIEQLLKI